MRLDGTFGLMLFLAFGLAHAAETETDPPLELIELLGEMEEAGDEMEIAMSEVVARLDKEGASAREVKDDE